MPAEMQGVLWTVGGCVITILGAGNLFFIKRLVDKIDSIENRMIELAQVVRVLQVLQNKKLNGGITCQERME